MSYDTALINMYASNIRMVAQDRGNRLGNYVTEDNLAAEKGFFDYLGETTAHEKTSRHADIIVDEPDFTKRMLSSRPFYVAHYIDQEDVARMVEDPASRIVQADANALNRKKDEVIIAAMYGTAYSGKDGTTAITLPSSQKVAVNYVESGVAAASNITLGKIRNTHEILGTNEVLDDNERPIWAYTSNQLHSLLKISELINDQFTRKALMDGQIVDLMGFTWVRTQRLPKTGNNRKNLAWLPSGVGFGVTLALAGSIDKVPTKGHRTRLVQADMMVGATRLEEVKVVEITCDESVV